MVGAMSNTDAIDAVFVDEWARVAVSAEMGRALGRWRDGSGGQVSAGSADELVAVLGGTQGDGRSRAAGSWLLEVNEPMSRRVLLQAAAKFVFGELRRCHLRGGDRRDWEQSCVTALHLAIAGRSGRANHWPMWSIRRDFIAELRVLGTEYERSGTPLVEDWAPSPEAIDHVATIAQVLRAAVDADRVSLRDAQIVWLYATGAETSAQIAARFSIAPSSVRKTKSRTVRALSHMMAAA